MRGNEACVAYTSLATPKDLRYIRFEPGAERREVNSP